MEYRVTRYNPKLRDPQGNFTAQEWTSFSDIGTSVTNEEYDSTEIAYIESALAMLKETNCKGLYVVDLEDGEAQSDFEAGDYLKLEELRNAFRSVLREEVWGRFENQDHFVHFGYDIYMYVGTPEKCNQSVEFAGNAGLYVEFFRSPYNDQSC